jgi:hypothetical protein
MLEADPNLGNDNLPTHTKDAPFPSQVLWLEEGSKYCSNYF